MDADLKSFISSYSLAFSESGRAYCERYGPGLSLAMRDAVSHQGGTIYVFGNGGSHAIARCFRHALLAGPSHNHSRRRIVASLDPDSYSVTSSTPGPVFNDMLRLDGAGDEDFVILLSGSGDSDNLVQVAKGAASAGINLIALVGKAECALKAVVPAENLFPVGIRDQQIGEDIIQYLLCLVAAGMTDPGAMASAFSRQAASIRQLPPQFVLKIAESVGRSFVKRERVRVLGLGHPALAACAEHTAHNLNWDAFYQVAAEPDVTIISSPSACDYSGIANDRRRQYLRHFSKIYGRGDKSTTLVYADSGLDPRIQELGIGTDGSLMETFVLCGASPPGGLPDANVFCSNLQDPFDHASLVQSAGHIVGRVLRLKLSQIYGAVGTDSSSANSVHQYLVEGDLAQRRLLDKA